MRLIQISAWNDSGGGFTHRLLDGHAGLRVWPFEMLLGRDGVEFDRFGENWFRGRFRWPRFGPALERRDGAELFDLISDSELKAVLHDPTGAKHRAYPVAVDISVWRRETSRRWASDGRFTQGSFLESYIVSFFNLLDGNVGEDLPILAHCPSAILDAPETWADLPDSRFVCVIRSPLSGFAEMSLRHAGLDPARYAAKWSLINGASILWAGKRPDRVRLLLFSDLLKGRELAMRDLCEWLSLPFDGTVLTPSWRGVPLCEAAMGPFGGIPSISGEREQALVDSLDSATRNSIQLGTEAVSSLLSMVNVD